MKLVYNFCSSVYSLTIIHLYVPLLPVTDDGQNDKKKSTSNTTIEKKKKMRRKKMIQGKIIMMLSLTVFKLNLSIHICINFVHFINIVYELKINIIFCIIQNHS